MRNINTRMAAKMNSYQSTLFKELACDGTDDKLN